MHNVGGFVALAALRHGREIGAVRLDEEQLTRRLAHDVGQLCRVLERQRPVDADVVPHLPEFVRRLEAARVAVEHAREITPLRLQNGKRIPVRVAVVDADGQSRRARHIELRAEKFALHGARLRVFLPVVVEPDLADGDNLRMLCPREELRTIRVCERCGALGVDADGGVECGICLRIGDHLRGCRHRIAHADDLHDACRLGTRNHLRAVFVIALIIEVGVRINEWRHFSISMRGKSCSAVPTV